jgi:HK97 family phage major capsid protein
MNKQEQRTALKQELEGLVNNVKAGDDDSITRAEEIMNEISEIDKHLEKAAAQAEVLKELGKTSAVTNRGVKKMAEIKSLGDAAVESIKASGIARGEAAGKATAEFKAATDTVVSPNPGDVSISNRIVALPNGRLAVRDLFPTEQVSTQTIGFYTINTEGAAGMTAEDGAKPQMSAEGTLTTTQLKKVAAIIKVSDEMLEDYPRLVSVINERGVYSKDLVVEDQLINGSGTGANITGLLNVTGIGTDTYANGATAQQKAEAIYTAAMDIKAATGFDADAVILNPADWEEIRLAKDANDQYFGGGFFQGQYGTAFGGLIPDIWGMRVAVSAYAPAGTIIVGAFRQGAAVAVKGGTAVTTGYDGVDFSHDRITLRIHERIALEVFAPQAFMVLTEAA